MTKSDLMDNFDDIVTDHRLSRAVCENHLEGLVGDAYLFDEFHVVASGGSSGQRGVFVYGWEAWAICYTSVVRFQICGIGSAIRSSPSFPAWLRSSPQPTRRTSPERSAAPSRELEPSVISSP